MATLAGEQIWRPLSNIIELLRPLPFRLEFALRLASICTLTLLLAEIYQTPEPAITAYIAFFVVKPDRMTSIVFSIVMLILISIILGLVFVTVLFVVDLIFWRVTSMCLLSFGMLFIGSASKLRPLAPVIALVTAFALSLLGSIQIGELATRGLLYVWLFIGIPASVSIAFNLLFGVAPRKLAEQAIAERLKATGELLRNPQSPSVKSAFQRLKRDGAAEILALVGKTNSEKTSSVSDVGALHQAALSLTPLMLACEALTTSGSAHRIVRQSLASTLQEMAIIFEGGGYPYDVTFEGRGQDPLDGALANEIQQILKHFTEAALPALPEAKKVKSGFFLPDAFSNPDHVFFALKVTVAAMGCYLLYSILDWQGIHTSLITCYIVALGNLAETVEKLTLRIWGCLVGAAMGTGAIVYVMPDVTSIGMLLIVVFIGALLSAWVAGGGPRIAYAGFQIGLAFLLCVVQGSSPAFDLSIARDRVIGILLGNLAIYATFVFIRPISIARLIDPLYVSWCRIMAAMLANCDHAGRIASVTQSQQTLTGIEQDLRLIRYEPRGLRPNQSWMRLRENLCERFESLQIPLFSRANMAPEQTEKISRKLAEFSQHFEVTETDSGDSNTIEAELSEFEILLLGHSAVKADTHEQA